MNKSAVEWLVENVIISAPLNWDTTILEQAKEMFEQQIIDARQSGINAVINGKSISNIDYYNETFKSE
jgi:hypothetical protein